MNILIFGASGATGHQLVAQAIKQKHRVTAFVRDPLKLKVKDKNVRVFQGNVTEYERVDDALKYQEAVLSALGASSPLRRDLPLLEGIKNIVASMKNHNIKRFIYQSFLGVRENREELGFLMNTLVPLVLKNVIADHEVKEGIIIKGNLDWTIIRPPKLTNGPFTGNYRHGEHIKPNSIFSRISRADVADFMLKQLDDKKYLFRKPRIMY